MANLQNTQTTLDQLTRARSLAGEVVIGGMRHPDVETLTEPLLDKEEARALDAVLNHLRRERGLDGSVYKRSFLLRRLAVRMRAGGVPTLLDYSRLLQSDRDELDTLLTALSINLSYFFRDEQVFDSLRWAVLEPLVARRAQSESRAVTVWSAGCANGEEPYSIAMILADVLGKELPRWAVLIHGTDVDEAALARARRGVYKVGSHRNPGAEYVTRFFIQDGDSYTLRPELRQMVHFVHHDVNAEPLRPHYDLVVCRNVLIYFTREHQSRLIRHLLQHLTPGGHLVLGSSEMLPLGMILAGHVEAVEGRQRIYRKPAQKKEHEE